MQVSLATHLSRRFGADSLLRPLLNATGDADSVTCILKANFGEQDDEITAPVSDGNLMTAVPIAASFALSSPALSATCGGMTNNCIQRNNAPDKVARCTAAGESCAKSFVFVGPYNGKSYPADKNTSRGCPRYGRSRACY